MVEQVTTLDYPTPAKWPKSTILDCWRIKNRYNIDLLDWRERLGTIIQAECAGQK